MISIVLPACNEERSIASTIKDLRKVGGLAEIIVVCNGCTDKTPAIAKTMRAKVIELPERDKCMAVLKGMEAARSELVGFIDADGAFNSDSIKELMREMDGNDAVIASKWLGRKFGKVKGSFSRKVGSRVWNTLSKTLLELDFSDTQAGLKIMRRNIFKRIDRNFICTGFAFDVELLYKIKKAGGKIKEVYIPVHSTGKKSSFGASRMPNMLKSVLRFWLHEKLRR